MAAADPRDGLSESHKEALAIGRHQAKVVREYLVALKSHRPKPGRKRTPASVQRRLDAVEGLLANEELADEDPIRVLELLQERIDLTAELAAMGKLDSFAGLERDFIEVAAAYGHRKGISYEVWRQMGVPVSTLREAGIRAGAGAA